MKSDEHNGKFAGSFEMTPDADDLEIGDEVCFLVKAEVVGSNTKMLRSGVVKLVLNFSVLDADGVSAEFFDKFAKNPKSTVRVSKVEPTLDELEANGPDPLEPPEPDYPEPIVDVVRSEELTENDVVMVDEDEEDEIFRPSTGQQQKIREHGDQVLKRFLEVM